MADKSFRQPFTAQTRQALERRGVSSDFSEFDRYADELLSGRRATGFRTLEYRPERDGVATVRTNDYRRARDGIALPAPLLRRPAQAPTPSDREALNAAIEGRAALFKEWDRNPQKESDANRFLREKAFGAKADKNNILRDSIDMYDPVFTKAMRQALQGATPEELIAMESLRHLSPYQAVLVARPGGRLNLSPQQKQKFLDMVERAGPDGQKIGRGARRYWGMETGQ